MPTIEQTREGGGAQASTEPGTANEQHEPHVDPLAHLPNVQPRGYFGPSQSAPPRIERG